jgi:hypothetical protein
MSAVWSPSGSQSGAPHCTTAHSRTHAWELSAHSSPSRDARIAVYQHAACGEGGEAGVIVAQRGRVPPNAMHSAMNSRSGGRCVVMVWYGLSGISSTRYLAGDSQSCQSFGKLPEVGSLLTYTQETSTHLKRSGKLGLTRAISKDERTQTMCVMPHALSLSSCAQAEANADARYPNTTLKHTPACAVRHCMAQDRRRE